MLQHTCIFIFKHAIWHYLMECLIQGLLFAPVLSGSLNLSSVFWVEARYWLKAYQSTGEAVDWLLTGNKSMKGWGQFHSPGESVWQEEKWTVKKTLRMTSSQNGSKTKRLIKYICFVQMWPIVLHNIIELTNFASKSNESCWIMLC